MRVSMFERPEGERTYWAVKGKNKGWRKEKKIPFCRGVSYLFGKSVLRGKKVLFTLHQCCFSTYYIMYKYMSWRVLLACTVGMCCTDCIVPYYSLSSFV